MSGKNVPPKGQNPVPAPAPGMLVVDASRGDRVGEFRGFAGPYWSLRPVKGGAEWEAAPEDVRPAMPVECLSAKAARENARSRGGVA